MVLATVHSSAAQRRKHVRQQVKPAYANERKYRGAAVVANQPQNQVKAYG